MSIIEAVWEPEIAAAAEEKVDVAPSEPPEEAEKATEETQASTAA
jgi:hypothetical protein